MCRSDAASLLYARRPCRICCSSGVLTVVPGRASRSSPFFRLGTNFGGAAHDVRAVWRLLQLNRLLHPGAAHSQASCFVLSFPDKTVLLGSEGMQ
jgi:hypothetical protein